MCLKKRCIIIIFILSFLMPFINLFNPDFFMGHQFYFERSLNAAEPPEENPAGFSEGLKHYFKLEKIYIKWQDGFCGSRKYYEGMLKSYLWELVEKDIQTDFNYAIASPEGMFNKKVRCKLRRNRWLHFYGELDVDEIKKIITDDPFLLKKWWRSGILFSISGKIKKFRISRDSTGDIIELYLYKIKLRI